MYLSQNFTLYEMTYSPTAKRNHIANIPTSQHITNLNALCRYILQPVRDHFQQPVHIESGYRNLILNRTVGGKENSQHTKGQAADFEIFGVDNFEVAKFIAGNLEFDQLILEYYNPLFINSGWIHCSYVIDDKVKLGMNRHQLLTISDKGRINGIKGISN